MHVKVRFYASFRELIGHEEVELELCEGSNLRDLLNKLNEKFGPMFEEALAESILQLEKASTMDSSVTNRSSGSSDSVVLVSEHIVNSENGLNAKLREGDRLTIIPFVAGG
jgi:molybdopterin converting factor small subunit